MQSNETFGKTVSELEKKIHKLEGISGFYEKWKDQLISIGIVLLLVIMIIVMWYLKHEISEMQNKIYQLNNDNVSLRAQLDAQAKYVLPAIKLYDNKGTEEFLLHVVQAGDCFENISEHYYQTSDYALALARLNGLKINSTLKIGEIIKVPQNKIEIIKEP